ncbi:hypothetical protein [Rhodopirellula baltica]|uniref:Uncharacterized protein n=1 Tax=Rhodopirellula baltica SWK14 TaxID=993516 RepID=L7CDH6_RHOBT|nr:hypothetical protein [Rhodopirellula baltica]ELP32038.1 hypothetical protein RBSWK_04036 [Rhodopirellula baltica SWK14]
MPDSTTLKIGDRIRITGVPIADLQQREREIQTNAEMAGWTADSIERIIQQTPIVQISRIDEYGCVWYDATVTGSDGREEEHSLIVYDDDTWEYVGSG